MKPERVWISFRCRAALTVAAAVGALAVSAPVALANYGPPSNLPPGKNAAVVSTAVNGRHIVRANLADKYAGHRFKIVVNDKIVARGKVGAKGRFVTWFRTKIVRGTRVRIMVLFRGKVRTVISIRA